MEMTPDKKPRVLSCIQPSGTFTLGNYLGALKNWVKMQEDCDCFFAVADLHAITVRQDPAKFREQIRSAFSMLLAIGLDPEKSPIFLQSHVAAHSQLAWILNCYTQFGELSRMTQFKDKSQKHADNVNAGLFDYPVLMAADILLYQADYVPIGEDQKQHLELARNIAERFNGAYSPTFTVPNPYIGKAGARVMSLQTPEKKMSKSDTNANGFISMLDTPDVIMKKFKRAVTDSEAKAGINNLMSIYSCITGKSYDEIAAEFESKGYGDFKVAVAEAVIEALRPIQEKYNQVYNEKDYLAEIYKKGATEAERVANKTLYKVMKKVGYIMPF